jgi:hypothetical protein
MRHFRRHADALAQRRVRVNRLADIDRVGAHFNGQRNLADHVACVGADDAAAQNLAVAVRLRAVVKQQLGGDFGVGVGPAEDDAGVEGGTGAAPLSSACENVTSSPPANIGG